MGGVAQILGMDYLNPFWWLAVAILGFKLFALIDAATRPEDAYRATDKKTKGFWLAVLGIAFGLDLLFGANFLTSFLTLAGLVAAIVYMVDVRPHDPGADQPGRWPGRPAQHGPVRPLVGRRALQRRAPVLAGPIRAHRGSLLCRCPVPPRRGPW